MECPIKLPDTAVMCVYVAFCTQVPTMIVYGERDAGAPVDTLHQMPNSKVFKIKNAGHACYMNDPNEWHRLLYNFLRSPKVFGD